MAKIANLYIYRDNPAELKRIAEEYVFLGRHIKIEGNKLTVFALPPRRPKKKDDDDKKRAPRAPKD